jgi:tripartite-type tricarboxylate transporter receptor subunit TctC
MMRRGYRFSIRAQRKDVTQTHSREVSMTRVLSFLLLGLLAAPLPVAAQQSAEGYPSRPVKVIVPYPPGAAADLIGRIVAQKLSEATGAQVFVENLPGAGGTIGTGNAARAAADGHTLLVINQDYVVQPAVKSKVPYDPFKSFVPVASVAAAPETISVHPSLPAANMQELIALVRANPGKYGYASPGYGTSPHVAVERLFKLTLGLDVVHVPFQGGAPAVAATIAGHTQILHITLPLIAQHVKEGKLRGIAVTDLRRSPMLPDLPTLAEQGVANHEVGYWSGVLVPAGTPKPIVDLLGAQLNRILSQGDVKERLATLGFAPLAGTPAELTAIIKAEAAEWDRVVRGARLAIE